jgi:hypothetical protein
VLRRAAVAATSVADEAIREAGRAAWFRAGFEEGLGDARERPRLGFAHRAEGERVGLLDGEARGLGADLGAHDGARDASVRAERQVVAQFHDLSATPRRLAMPAVPAYAPDLPAVEEPSLEALLAELPARELGARGAEEATWLASSVAPAWSDPHAAFERWLADVERSACYRELASEPERLAFADAFEEAFAARVAARTASDLLPAFETGVGRGFDYGRFLRAEYEFRHGFRAGWLAAFDAAARDAFDRAWAMRYAERYAALFDEWSSEPKLEIGEAELDEGNRDGVFEPGEPVSVAFRLVNYGGGGGRRWLELEGAVLATSSRIPVDVASRSILAAEGALAARIAERAPLHADSRLELRVDGVSRELPLRVSRPLELVRDTWRLERRDLDGRVALAVELQNASRLSVAGRVELSTASRPGLVVDRDLGTLRAGERRTVELGVEGLEPLDLLGGRVALDLAVLSSGGVLQDEWTAHVPDAARDLQNRDLVLYAVRLAHERASDPRLVAAARALLFTRLEADWKLAAAGVGNPYRFDHRHGAATTALGDLVLTCAALDPVSRSHEIFAGLSDEVLELSVGLPGTHPFLLP